MKFWKELILLALVLALVMSQVSAEYRESDARFTSSRYGLGTFFNQGTQIERKYCDSGQDFVLQLAPFGCSPAVVRSDLLEEQDARVFCQIVATKINPLIGVDAINSVRLSGEYSSDVRDIGFHAQRVALGDSNDIDVTTPLMNKLGYAVIVLKQQKNASAMPAFVEGNITATLRYDLTNAFGVGKVGLYLPLMTDSQWEFQKDQYGFWNARAFLRATDISADRARISVRTDSREIANVYLEEGKESSKIYLPGFDCLAGFKIKLDDLVVPERRVRLNINGEIVQVAEGEDFLDGKCRATEVKKQGIVEKASIRCREDERTNKFDLAISPKVKLKIDGIEGEFQTGDKLYDGGEKTVYLGYVGTEEDSYNQEKLFIYTFAMPIKQDKLTGDELKDISNVVDSYEYQKISGNSLADLLANFGRNLVATTTNAYQYMFDGNSYNKIGFSETDDVEGKKVSVIGFKDAFDKTLDPKILELYEKASADYNTVISGFASAKYPDNAQTTKGEEAYKELIDLNGKIEQKRTAAELCKELKRDYPNSKALAEFKQACENPLLFSNPEKVTQHVTINNKIKEISFQGISYPKFDDYGVQAAITGPNGVRKVVDLRYGQPFYLEGMRNEIAVTGESPANTIFTIPSEYDDQLEHDVFFRYREISPAGWLWSFDKQNWMNVSEMEVKGGKYDGWDLINIYGDLAISLRGKNFSEGSVLVTAFTKRLREKVLGITDKNACEDCGKDIFDFCTEKECTAIGEKIGKACQYTSSSRSCITISGTSSVTDAGKKPYGEYIKINNLDEDWAEITANLITPTSWRDRIGNFLFESENKKINLGQTIDVGQGFKVSIAKINLKRVAKVSINDEISRTEAKASFPFKIGIEQRGIQLTPDEARKKIEQLNKTVAEFEEKSEKLGQIVKGMKTACIGTSAALMIKNFLENKDGKAIARREVMRGPNGWYERCTDMVNQKQYRNVDDCLYQNADAINEEVKNWYGFQNTLNEEIKNIQAECDKTNLLGENVVDDACFLNGYVDSDYRSRIKQCISRMDDNSDGFVEMQDDKINITEFADGLNKSRVSIEEFRQLDLYCRVQGSESLNLMSGARLNAALKDLFENNNANIKVSSLAGEIGRIGSGTPDVSWAVSEGAIKGGWNGWMITSSDVIGGEGYFESGKSYKAKIQGYGSDTYLFILDGKDSELGAVKAFKYEGQENGKIKVSDADQEITRQFGYRKYDSSSYQNPYKYSQGTTYPVIKYYETEPNKGLPAIVPFDLANGWYAKITNTLPAFGAIQSYDESGKVRSFSLCNVGENGIEENEGSDDICELINTGTRMPYNQFNNLEPTKVSELVREAYNAIETASRLHGQSRIDIGSKAKGVRVGAPAVDIPDIQCQDFMSPTDCRILFNVCDPVICPSSRCDLNGKFPVQDVVQTGIIGSIALCLPNFPEVYIPVCLTGVKAGLDGWLSVHKSYMQCLQHGIDTGETVGICDEIYSLYKCEFFWRNAAPFAKIAVPKALEIIFGQNTRGGGEYLGVKTALENTESSVNYFTKYYADDTFRSFQSRATENVGGEICKAYVSGVIPTNGNALDILTEPDSPPQFTGRFDEIPYTTVTNPPQSQYKVFYHIFAGKDRGAYFKVYFKGESDPYYRDTGLTRNLASGYIAKGDFATDTLDFTAPSGYKQLCIMVNDQEECGFKEVTTDFGLNYLTEKYIQQEAERRDIKSETDCVAGSRNVYSLINPNLQEGASNALNPAIYNQGLIRMCATKDPGQGYDANAGGQDARWVKVGTCNANMKCWLDTYSVKSIIKNLNIEGEILKEQEEAAMQALAEGPNYIDEPEYGLIISKIKAETNIQKRINNLTDLLINNKLFWSRHKGEAYLQRGNAYKELTISAYESIYGKPEEAKPNETDEIDKTYSSPIFEFDDGIAGTFTTYYSFSQGIWRWSFDKENWMKTSQEAAIGGAYDKKTPDERDLIFIRKLNNDGKSYSYANGLKALMDRTVKDDESKGFWEGFNDIIGGKTELITDTVVFKKDKIFELDSGQKLFLKYEDEWKWSIDDEEWFGISDIDAGQPNLIDDSDINLLNDIQDKGFYEGAKIIFDINARVSIGGVYLAENRETGFKICLEPGKVNLKEYEDYLIKGPLAPDACRVAVEGVLNDNCASINSCSDYGYRPSCENNVCRLQQECMWQTDACVENTNSLSTVSPEFYIKDGGVWGTGFLADNAFYLVYNFKYSGDKGKWVASYDKNSRGIDKLPSGDYQNLIKSLEGVNYFSGLILLLDIASVNKDELITDKVTFEDGIYKIDYEELLFLKYEDEWKWSIDGDEWFGITDIDAGQPTLIDSRSIALLQSLEGLDAYFGARTIFNINLDLPLPTRDVALSIKNLPIGHKVLIKEIDTGEEKCLAPLDAQTYLDQYGYDVMGAIAPDCSTYTQQQCQKDTCGIGCQWQTDTCVSNSAAGFKQRSFAEVGRIVYAASAPESPRDKILSGKCRDFVADIVSASENYQIDPLLLFSLMQQESSCRIDASSGDYITFDEGASYGLMQISGRIWCGEFRLPITQADCVNILMNDPSENINVGAHILRDNYDSYSSTPKTLKCDAFKSVNSEGQIIQDEPAVDVTYTGWENALRWYQGWGCARYKADGSQVFSDHDYVEKIMERYDKLATLT
ncbi:transglycosylase SLT domain-containing protein [Candidatus Pacearchaeota archaeon]|nr:transglycosylase SLT domain-containing protein [Candidatus Pacearchaeota archaeon]